MLETQRLILRPFQEADLKRFTGYRSDAEVARDQGWEIPYTQAQGEAFIREMKNKQPGRPGEWYQFAVERKHATGLIGECAFHIFEHDNQQAEIGFSLARPNQGQGYGTEAVRRLLHYLFGELGLHRVTGTRDAENHGSARLLQRVGMRWEGHFIENIWFKGAWGSEYSYAILQREWGTVENHTGTL